jgi:hypothetical protein
MKETTKALLEAIDLSLFTSFAAAVDFGIRSLRELGAYQWGRQHECFSEEELDEACCDGPKLTKLVNRTNDQGYENPYACIIETMWDCLPEEE